MKLLPKESKASYIKPCNVNSSQSVDGLSGPLTNCQISLEEHTKILGQEDAVTEDGKRAHHTATQRKATPLRAGCVGTWPKARLSRLCLTVYMDCLIIRKTHTTPSPLAFPRMTACSSALLPLTSHPTPSTNCFPPRGSLCRLKLPRRPLFLLPPPSDPPLSSELLNTPERSSCTTAPGIRTCSGPPSLVSPDPAAEAGD